MNFLSYVEKKTHGTSDFPLAYYYVDEIHPNYEMPFHWHREMEISYILSGSYTFYLDDDVVTACAGDVVFIDSGVVHGGKPDDCVYECIVFNPKAFLPTLEVCKQYILGLIHPNTRIFTYFAAGHPICDITKNLMDAAKKQLPGAELSILIHLYQWFINIYETNSYTRQETGTFSNDKKMQVLKPVLEYIETHYTQTITVEELASLTHLSPNYFIMYFKSLIHKTPINYINYYRVERSCQLLTNTQLSVTEIAYRVGFNDSGYFIKHFKACKGMTPQQYKRL